MVDVSLDSVSKRYWLRRPSSSQSARWWRRAKTEEFWALRDLTLDVERGEALGIIGPNGAGKSTILKLLSGITAPTSGEIRIAGRLTALIEVGSGFHPELTGRENIYLSGAILGMRRRDITAKLDRIVEFSGVGEFIDSPVKFYSSGMYVRLGFAISAHVDPDIVLVDEAMAVGDQAFQERCYQRMGELRKAGTTILVISHDLDAIEHLCRRAILMRGGRMVIDGPAADVCTAYRQWISGLSEHPVTQANASIRIDGVSILAHGGSVRTGDPLTVRVDFTADRAVNDAVFDLYYATHGSTVIHTQQTTGLRGALRIDPGRGAIQFSSDEIGLQPGAYSVTAIAGTLTDGVLHSRAAGTKLVINEGKQVRGHFYMPHRAELMSRQEIALEQEIYR